MVRHWRIEMLGGLRVVLQAGAGSRSPDAGQTHSIVERFTTAKCAALLAYLALHPRRAYSREALIALLWPDAQWENGQTSLRAALAALRRQLEPAGTPPQSLFLVTRQTLRLNPDAFSTDVADFEAALRRKDAARCHELYCGDLLPTMYYDWAISERERLSVLWENVSTAAPMASPAPLRVAVATSPTVETAPIDVPQIREAIIAGRLPLALGRCFGRESDISRLCELFLGTGKTPPRRLVTLTGPGGIGKTRLALEAARVRLAPAFGQDVFWANLADVEKASGIGERIANEALHLPPSERAGEDRWEAVIQAFAAYSAPLLVLDNLEQLTQTSDAAALLTDLLTRVPQLLLLITSRRRLFISGEWEFPVAPLSLPDPALLSTAHNGESDEGVMLSSPALQSVAESAAIQFFVERAQSVRPDFALTPRNAQALFQVCCRLDGLPLALELVAARAQTLTPTQMEETLTAQSGLQHFADKRAHKEVRHQSVHAAIAWSVRLLPPVLREFWSALSVFRGGFSADAVRAVLKNENADEILTQLRERSLLTLHEVPFSASGGKGGDYLRFGFLETLRQFAGELLDETPAKKGALAAAHAAYFTDTAETTLPALLQKSVGRNLNALEIERANLNAALVWCDSQPSGEAEQIGLRLCAALWRFWEMRGPIAEGRAHLSACLAKSQTVTEARASALNGAGMLAARQGDYETARSYHEECLRTYQTLCHTRGEAVALGNLGLLAAEQNRYDEARALYEKSLLLRREIGDTFGVALMLNNLGNLVDELGDPHLAQIYLEECLVLHRQRGDKVGIAQALGNLGNAHYRAENADKAIALHEEGLALLTEINDKRGMACALLNLSEMAQGRSDTKQAREKLKQCLPLVRDLGDKRMLAFAFDSVAHLARTEKRPKVAALLHGAAARLREQTGVHIPPVQQKDYATAIARLQNELGDAAYNKAFEKGRALGDEATKAALELLA